MPIEVTPTGASCGASVRGVDFGEPLSETELQKVIEAWLEYHVLTFPDQKLNDDQLEAFAAQFGEL